jgi:hypothetical protein
MKLRVYSPHRGTAHDEAEARERDERLEAGEMYARLWAVPIETYENGPPIHGACPIHIDPETGCTAAEMKKKRLRFAKRRIA